MARTPGAPAIPVHNWALVEANIVHDFHVVWLGTIQHALNGGLLPDGHYALIEQHLGRSIADAMTLHATPARPPIVGGTALAEAPPRVQRRQSFDPVDLTLRRTLAVRLVSGHRLVALLEIISPANKDREAHVEDFADKAGSALSAGVHLLLVDLFPPGTHDPQGMHAAVLARMGLLDEPYDLPPGEPFTLAAYVAGPRLEVFASHLKVGLTVPDMPLFLRPGQYVNVPLEQTYQSAYRGMPAFWRDVLEGRPPAVV